MDVVYAVLKETGNCLTTFQYYKFPVLYDEKSLTHHLGVFQRSTTPPRRDSGRAPLFHLALRRHGPRQLPLRGRVEDVLHGGRLADPKGPRPVCRTGHHLRHDGLVLQACPSTQPLGAREVYTVCAGQNVQDNFRVFSPSM